MITVGLTGAGGFIGRNLAVGLRERACNVLPIAHVAPQEELTRTVQDCEVIVHVAGVNRPSHPDEFRRGNVGFTEALATAVRRSERTRSLIFASSAQAGNGTPYGASKQEAEDIILTLGAESDCLVNILRLPNVFGKWARPNYNSAVATFCHNAARGIELTVHDPGAELRLLYIDDLVSLIARLVKHPSDERFPLIPAVYGTTVGKVADAVRSIARGRETLFTEAVGGGLMRALHATYVSNLPADAFDYALPVHVDDRGAFVEMIKTPDHGQVSFFSSAPGVTRGRHYHHSKVEKFLVVQGQARFRFRSLQDDSLVTLDTVATRPRVVESIPGWSHEIMNTGSDPLIVLLWANEVFDPDHPDTITHAV